MVMNEVCITVGMQNLQYAQQIDEQYVICQNRCNSLEGQKARKDKLQVQNDAYEEQGLLYGAVIAD